MILTASSFFSIFTQVPNSFNSTVELCRRFLEASRRRCRSSSGFSLSQFVLFLHVIQIGLMIRSDLCLELLAVVRQKYHWIITINGKINVWKCKLIFPSDTLHKNIKITDLKPFLAAENTSVLIIYIYIYICVYIYVYIYIYIYTHTHTVPSLSIGTV